MKAVCVHWIDSAGQDGWIHSSDLSTEFSDCVSIGLVCEENSEVLVLIGTLGAVYEQKGHLYHSPIVIPRECIRSVKVLAQDHEEFLGK
jgi:hypothetical protein